MSLRASGMGLAPPVMARRRHQAGEPSPVRWGLLRHNHMIFFLFSSFLLFSCAPATPSASPRLVTVYSTSAAQPWLPALYACAESRATLSRVDDPIGADILLRIGEPQVLVSPAFQIDTEELLLVTHRQSPVQNLTLEEARTLFTGRGDPALQVWVYAEGEDVQEVFDRVVMAGRNVSPSARIAFTPQQMSDTLVKEIDAVGILPRRWKVGDTREVLSVATVPVLAITEAEPLGEIQELIACLQK